MSAPPFAAAEAPPVAAKKGDGAPPPGAQPAAQPAGEPKVQRQIVYKADVAMEVEDLTPLSGLIDQLVKDHHGFVADSQIHAYSGTSRSASWKLRVPAAEFEPFLAALRLQGELRSQTIKSDDVSEEFYDVAARIRNRQKEEQRLLALLDEKTGKLEDVLAVERELSRVREEIERFEGRMNVLKDLVSLATITLTVNEIRRFEPSQSASLGTRISRVWFQSWTALRVCGENLLLFAVGAVPWLILPSLGLVIAVLFFRRLSRRGT